MSRITRTIYKRRKNKRRSKTVRKRQCDGSGPVYPSTPNVQLRKAWVITLPGSKRIDIIAARAKTANIPIDFFYGVDAKQLDVSTLADQGVSKVLYTARGKKDKEVRNMGTIACFLSRRSLYRKIADEYSNDTNSCHLIFEDDIYIPPDFLEVFKRIIDTLPEDWEILYFSKSHITGKKVSDTLTKLSPVPYGNIGAWAVLYKYSTIRDKLLPALKNMNNEMDVQVQQLFDTINAYCCDPPVLTEDFSIKSTIQVLDSDVQEELP